MQKYVPAIYTKRQVFEIDVFHYFIYFIFTTVPLQMQQIDTYTSTNQDNTYVDR